MAHSLRRLLQKSKRLDEAVEAMRQSVAYLERTSVLAPKVAVYQDNLAYLSMELAGLLASAGRPKESDALYARSLNQFATLVKNNPLASQRLQAWANTYWAMANVFAPDGRAQDAQRLGAKSLAGLAANAETSRDVHSGLFLAMAHWHLGSKDKARKWYDQAVQWMEKNQPKNEELLRFRAEAEK